MEMFILVLFAGGFACLLMLGFNDKPRAIAALRLRAEQQFRITKISDPVQSIEFDGSKATILETRETQYLATLLPSNYVLTVVSKMPERREIHLQVCIKRKTLGSARSPRQWTRSPRPGTVLVNAVKPNPSTRTSL